MYSCNVGGMNHLALPLHLRLSLDGFLLEEPVHLPHLPPVPFTTSLLLPLMTSFAGFGVSKKTQGMTTTFPLKNAPTCGTSVRHTPIRALEGSSFPSTNQQAIPFEVSRSQAIWRFLSLERSLHSKDQFPEFSAVMEEYLEMYHAELVPVASWLKPLEKVLYLPIQAIRKEHNTTTKMRAMFDPSAKSSTSVSLKDTLLVGLTACPPTTDRCPTEVSTPLWCPDYIYQQDVYQAIKFALPDCSLHRFVWRGSPDEPFLDCWITKVTFGVSASSFATNMAVKQNALDFATEHLQIAEVMKSFYIDDSLTGADSVQEAIKLQRQLQDLLAKDASSPQVEFKVTGTCSWYIKLVCHKLPCITFSTKKLPYFYNN